MRPAATGRKAASAPWLAPLLRRARDESDLRELDRRARIEERDVVPNAVVESSKRSSEGSEIGSTRWVGGTNQSLRANDDVSLFSAKCASCTDSQCESESQVLKLGQAREDGERVGGVAVAEGEGAQGRRQQSRPQSDVLEEADVDVERLDALAVL